MIERICAIEGCARPVDARGWCHKHYEYWRKRGTPTPPPRDRVAEFWSRVERGGTAECWPWIGPRMAYDGRGTLWWDGVRTTAPRAAWSIAHGGVPDGMFVCHSCDNPPCVNVAHLWLGSHAENMADMNAKGRHGATTLRGEAVPGTKLTERQVRAIRADPRGPKAVAEEYGIDPSNVWMIRTRRSWAWLD